MMVPSNQSGEKLMTALFKRKLIKKEEEKLREKAYEVIKFLNLTHFFEKSTLLVVLVEDILFKYKLVDPS